MVTYEPRVQIITAATVAIIALHSGEGGIRKHTFSVCKSLILLTLKPCFMGITTPSSNSLFMPVSAVTEQHLIPDLIPDLNQRLLSQRLSLSHSHLNEHILESLLLTYDQVISAHRRCLLRLLLSRKQMYV